MTLFFTEYLKRWFGRDGYTPRRLSLSPSLPRDGGKETEPERIETYTLLIARPQNTHADPFTRVAVSLTPLASHGF